MLHLSNTFHFAISLYIQLETCISSKVLCYSCSPRSVYFWIHPTFPRYYLFHFHCVLHRTRFWFCCSKMFRWYLDLCDLRWFIMFAWKLGQSLSWKGTTEKFVLSHITISHWLLMTPVVSKEIPNGYVTR